MSICPKRAEICDILMKKLVASNVCSSFIISCIEKMIIPPERQLNLPFGKLLNLFYDNFKVLKLTLKLQEIKKIDYFGVYKIVSRENEPCYLQNFAAVN